MLKFIQEHGVYVLITGVRNIVMGKAELLLREIRQSNQADLSVQFFNANLIATWEHIYFAVLDSLMAFATNRNISKSLAVEIMLYASAQRQIKKAIEMLGVSHDCTDVAVVVVGRKLEAVEKAVISLFEHLCTEADEKVLEFSKEKARDIRKTFDIGETELDIVTKKGDREKALVEIIIERMALLATQV